MAFVVHYWHRFIKSNFALRIKSLVGQRAPSAAQVWAQQGGNHALHPFWLFAAPVNVQLGQISYFLTEPAPVLISQAESQQIIGSLNIHFNADGYYFYVVNGTWFLGLNTKPLIHTTPLNTVKNKDVSPFLPTGEDALIWATLQNEVQMLLHSHVVNEVRETQGQPAINSVWFYGLGASTAA